MKSFEAHSAAARTRVVATADLEVYARAVTPWALGGELCPTPGGFDAMTPQSQTFGTAGMPLAGNPGVQLQGSGWSARNRVFGIAFTAADVQISKPRYGYPATSGTG